MQHKTCGLRSSVVYSCLSVVALSVTGVPGKSIAADAVNIWGIVDTSSIATTTEGISYVFEADGTIQIGGDHTIGAKENWDGSGQYAREGSGGTWTAPALLGPSLPISREEAILTRTNQTGTVQFLGNSIVNGNIGRMSLALKEIQTGSGAVTAVGNLYTRDLILNSGFFSVTNDKQVFTNKITVNGTGQLSIGSLNSLDGTSGTDIEFFDDGNITISDNAVLGEVRPHTGSGGSLGTLTLNGAYNTIRIVNRGRADGLKRLILGAGRTEVTDNLWTDAVDFGAADGVLVTGQNGSVGDVTTQDGKGTLIISGPAASGPAIEFTQMGLDNAALREVRVDVGAQLTSRGFGLYTKSLTLAADDSANDGGYVRLGANSQSGLDHLTFGIGYDSVGTAFSAGQIDARQNLGHVLKLGTLAVSTTSSISSTLLSGWIGRGGDDALFIKDEVLRFNTLQNTAGEAITFRGPIRTAAGNSYAEADNMTVNSPLALWRFSLVQNSGSTDTAALLSRLDATHLAEVASEQGANMDNLEQVTVAMTSVVTDNKADPNLQEVINSLPTSRAGSVVPQMADSSVNNAISGAINAVSNAATKVIATNIDKVGLAAIHVSGQDSGLSAGDPSGRRNLWGQALMSRDEQDRRKGVDGYSASSYGFALGADTLIFDQTRLGLSLHYAKTKVNGKGVYRDNRSDIDTYGITLYGQQNLTDSLFLDGQVGYAYNRVRARRYVDGIDGAATGSYGANQISAGVKAGYRAEINDQIAITPHAGVSYSHLSEGSYTEDGSIARLRVGSRNSDSLVLGTGVRGIMEFRTGPETRVVPEIRLGAYYDTLASSVSTTAQFVGGGTSFITRNVKPDPWTFNLGAGVNLMHSGNIAVSANYDAALREKFAGHTVSLRGKIQF